MPKRCVCVYVCLPESFETRGRVYLHPRCKVIIYVHTHTYIYLYIYTHTHKHTHTHTRTSTVSSVGDETRSTSSSAPFMSSWSSGGFHAKECFVYVSSSLLMVTWTTSPLGVAASFLDSSASCVCVCECIYYVCVFVLRLCWYLCMCVCMYALCMCVSTLSWLVFMYVCMYVCSMYVCLYFYDFSSCSQGLLEFFFSTPLHHVCTHV